MAPIFNVMDVARDGKYSRMNADEIAKREYFHAFHEDAEKKLAFLLQLYDTNHREEAMTLCLTYIDSFSHWLEWPNTQSSQNFVNAVIKFGNDSLMGLVHPLQAVRAFQQMKPIWQAMASKIKGFFPGPRYDLLEQTEFLTQLAAVLSAAEILKVRHEIWRTTMAAVAYYNMRNPSVHGFGAGTGLSFSGATYQGNSPVFNFARLHKVAVSLHSELRRRSESTGQWFGNDDIIFS